MYVSLRVNGNSVEFAGGSVVQNVATVARSNPACAIPEVKERVINTSSIPQHNLRTYHDIDMSNPIPHLVSPRLKVRRSRIRPGPKLLRRPPPNSNEQHRGLESGKPRPFTYPPMTWHGWGILEL